MESHLMFMKITRRCFASLQFLLKSFWTNIYKIYDWERSRSHHIMLQWTTKASRNYGGSFLSPRDLSFNLKYLSLIFETFSFEKARRSSFNSLVTSRGEKKKKKLFTHAHRLCMIDSHSLSISCAVGKSIDQRESHLSLKIAKNWLLVLM